MAALAALLIAVGAFGSWVAADSAVDLRGIEGDGVLTLAIALVIAATLIVARLRRATPSRWTLLGCAVLVVAIAAYDIVDVLGTDFGPLGGTVGWGLWLTLAAGFALLTIALRDWRTHAEGKR